jgi:hypothetical protein
MRQGKFVLLLLKNSGQFVALSVAIFATTFYLFNNIREQREARQQAMRSVYEANQARSLLERQTLALEASAKQYDELLQKLVSVQKRGGAANQSGVETQLTALKQNIDDLGANLTSVRSQVTTLTAALGVDAEKSLSLPLLRKDVEDLKGGTQRDIDSVRAEMARTYDFIKWIIGLIVAALLGTVINNFVQTRRGPRSPVRFE